MTFTAGTTVGPYEIASLLGAGGMGEVYRARDPRIGRNVAIKVIRSSFNGDPERLGRFEQEVRAAGALNHPNILSIYDVGASNGSPYLVSELLEGETLRDRLTASPLPLKKAIDFALQIAQGLAAAHDKGIIHRDLKPENLFITKDGRVKILDFGLAKLTRPEVSNDGSQTTISTTPGTQTGMVLGTVGYMSPEQVRGEKADHRSDIFSFGAILYEMLSGKRAFEGETAVEKMNAILKIEPETFELTSGALGLISIVEHCLEKEANQRFQSATDVGYALEAIAGVSSSTIKTSTTPASRRSGLLYSLGAMALVVIVAWIAFLVGGGVRSVTVASKIEPLSQLPIFHRLTFRQGFVDTAKFGPDGQTIVYSASWNGGPFEVFSTRVDGRESRSLGIKDAQVQSISPAGEMLLILHPYSDQPTLATVSLSGGEPRELLKNAYGASWAPDGKTFAVLQSSNGMQTIQFPPGRTIYQTTAGLTTIRFSPHGDYLAFFEGSIGAMAALKIIDLKGTKKILYTGLIRNNGIAWRNDNEVWFASPDISDGRAIHSVTLDGKHRIVYRSAGILILQDQSPSGGVLLTQGTIRNRTLGVFAGDTEERDISYMERSVVNDVSSDGKTVLFYDLGDAGGTYIEKIGSGGPVRIGDDGDALSPDGLFVAGIVLYPHQKIVIVPTGAGESRSFDLPDFEDYQTVGWLPDGKQLLFFARERNHQTRMYALDLTEAKVRPVTDEGVSSPMGFGHFVSPDGKKAFGESAKGGFRIYSLDGTEPIPISGLAQSERPIGWTEDGHSIYVTSGRGFPQEISKVDLASGRKTFWKEFRPPDATNFGDQDIIISPDGRHYVYSYTQNMLNLYFVDNLR